MGKAVRTAVAAISLLFVLFSGPALADSSPAMPGGTNVLAPQTTGLASPSQGQSGQGNGQAPLVHQVFTDCFTGLPPGTPGTGNGFAILREHDGVVSGEVALKNALPNTTYQVALTEIPSGAFCNVYTATLTTNGQGNGSVHIENPLVPGTTGAFVDVVSFSPFDFYNSEGYLF